MQTMKTLIMEPSSFLAYRIYPIARDSTPNEGDAQEDPRKHVRNPTEWSNGLKGITKKVEF